MNAADLLEFRLQINARYDSALALTEDLQPASSDTLSIEPKYDAYAEAIFLRAFSAYENDIEKLFLHFVTGGTTISGVPANTYLRVPDEHHARRLMLAGNRYLSWSKPEDTRKIAENYIEDGWPISAAMSAKSHDLVDCRKIRNRIAHDTIESRLDFKAVQINLLRTERLFDISVGQVLRVRNTKLKKLHLAYYLVAMRDTTNAIFEPPA